jgi:ssDNA-binding Zn-finger/Zn-ribbon topoisomerase 1
MTVIKVCGDPYCEAIFHNTPKDKTKCLDCGGKLIYINTDTFVKKYSNVYCQYDYNTQEYFRPLINF